MIQTTTTTEDREMEYTEAKQWAKDTVHYTADSRKIEDGGVYFDNGLSIVRVTDVGHMAQSDYREANGWAAWHETTVLFNWQGIRAPEGSRSISDGTRLAKYFDGVSADQKLAEYERKA